MIYIIQEPKKKEYLTSRLKQQRRFLWFPAPSLRRDRAIPREMLSLGDPMDSSLLETAERSILTTPASSVVALDADAHHSNSFMMLQFVLNQIQILSYSI